MTEKSIEDMAADTLAGDLRDMMLTHIRSMENPWSKMSERQQEDKIFAVTRACESAVRRGVAILAARDMPHISATISKFTVKDGIKAELVAASSVANIEKMAEFQNEPALLVFASPEAYLGARSEAKPDPDQPELPVDEDGDGDSDVDWNEGADNSEPFPETDEDIVDDGSEPIDIENEIEPA